MCLLTVFPMPGLVDDATIRRLANGAEVNDDGSGFAVVTGRKIVTGKSMTADDAIAAFADAYKYATGPALFHSRWSTHGVKTVANVHPFRVGGRDDTYVAHNGILPSDAWPTKGDKRSDTRIFADDLLPGRWARLDRNGTRDSLSKWLAGNKVAILTTNKRYARNLYLFGMSHGEWVDGVWYSNSDYTGDWTRHYPAAYATGEYGPCLFCKSPDVSAWGICRHCQSCQDCLESAADCLCYVSPSARPDEEPEVTTIAPVGTGKELVRWEDGLRGLGSEARFSVGSTGWGWD